MLAKMKIVDDIKKLRSKIFKPKLLTTKHGVFKWVNLTQQIMCILTALLRSLLRKNKLLLYQGFQM